MRGDLVRCGQGVRPVGWPDSARVRAHALSGQVAPGRIASHLTAAWVWGAARHPGTSLQATVTRRRRRHPARDSGITLVHRPCAEEELARFGPVAVTTPRRTLIDLIHDAEGPRGNPDALAPDTLVACRLLAWQIDGGIPSFTSAELHERRSTRRARLAVRLCRL